jgi:hypothetical protein
MLRVLGTFGLGIVFVVISPALRQSLLNDVDTVQKAIGDNSPWSYVAIGVAVLCGVMYSLHRAAQPHV